MTWKFETNGIPRADWMRRQAEIEAILNKNIIDIVEVKGNKRYILLQTVTARTALSKNEIWKDNYLSPNGDFELVCGKSMKGHFIFDLASTPHILIGGGTGSEKSFLLKLLLLQCIKKGAMVFIADLKGGLDFPVVWHNHCEIITEEEKVLDLLTKITSELERRRELFVSHEASNITEFNKKCETLPRIIFACDEVAEILDKTGLDKEHKEIVAQVENKLSTLARLGRAFGIHLILAMQRPDAAVLTGQIKANLPLRICGRADSILSQIILDNSDAAENIPKDAQGLFLTNWGTKFQSFILNEQNMFTDIADNPTDIS
ncbi:MAG: FtsK/SpoIIIE domain-containing protein, partial [Bacillota bacterium]